MFRGLTFELGMDTIISNVIFNYCLYDKKHGTNSKTNIQQSNTNIIFATLLTNIISAAYIARANAVDPSLHVLFTLVFDQFMLNSVITSAIDDIMEEIDRGTWHPFILCSFNVLLIGCLACNYCS